MSLQVCTDTDDDARYDPATDDLDGIPVHRSDVSDDHHLRLRFVLTYLSH
jgi:hypothetical protein